LWAGDGAIRTHYDNAPGNPSPGLPPGPNLIPLLPYTTADATTAKVTRTLSPPHMPVPGQSQGTALLAPAQVQAEVAPPTVAAARNVGRTPYNFWPEMPWSPKPDIAGMTRADVHNKEAINAWLQTKPLMSSEDGSR
jgi:hypothetical protein